VGIDDGDVRGDDHRAIQAAIDYVANLKGGTVEILPGRYVLRNAIHLRSGVTLSGTRGKSILVLGSGARTSLARDVAKGATEITLADPSEFKIGDGVFLQDRAGHGFEVTTATLVERTGPKSFRLSQPTDHDYLVARQGEVKLGFSGIAGWNIANATVEGVTVEGNWGQTASEYLGGCRGGGIYLFGCDRVTIRQCSVFKINGDAISFQGKCKAVTVEHCLCEDNANVGLHPGSYSRDSKVRHNVLRKNGYVGLFVCVGVRGTLFENNEVVDNAGCGISIGFDDSDNVFRGNRIVNNAETGVLFRRDSPKAEHGAHRNVFEKNIIRDNLGPRPARSNSRPSSAGKAGIVIEGNHHDLVFRDNDVGFSQPHTGSAVLHDEGVKNLEWTNNRLQNVTQAMAVHQAD
jgi:parallel beta-helix repeat protein